MQSNQDSWFMVNRLRRFRFNYTSCRSIRRRFFVRPAIYGWRTIFFHYGRAGSCGRRFRRQLSNAPTYLPN